MEGLPAPLLMVEAEQDAFWSAHGRRWRELASGAGRPRSRVAAGQTSRAPIPPVVHHIWLGGPIPARLRRLVKSWQALHPNWSHLLWEDDDVAALELFNQPAFDSATNQGQRSDILRYELLAALGGAYVDVDVQCVGSLSTLHSESTFYCGISNTGVFELNNAVIGCVRGHACVVAVMSAISRNCCGLSACVGGPAGFMATIEHTGPGVLTRTVMPLLLASERCGDCDDAASLEGRALLHELVELQSGAGAARMQRSRASIVQRALYKLRAVQAGCELHDGLGLFEADGVPSPLFEVGALEAHLRTAVVLPKEVFYPVPNTAVVPLPRIALDDAAWDHVYGELDSEAQRASDEAWLREAVGDVPAQFIARASGCIGVHYWARSWQRPSAQIAAVKPA